MEEWKSIPGYEGIYEASNLGRIRTAFGKTTSNARFPQRVWKQRVLKSKHCKRPKSNQIQELVTLWKDGSQKTFLVARLVAMTWCDGYKQNLTVNHIDGNAQNNRAENLEWISLAENIDHGYSNGLYSRAIGCTLVSESGEKASFRSLSEASKHIGRPSGYISNCLKRGAKIHSASGEAYGLA